MLAKALQSAAGNAAAPTDPQFPYVTMLLHGDGTNGAQNNTFLDASANAFTITRNGNTTQGSFSPYGDNWSNYFDGASYLQLADSTAWDLSADYTIEMWLFVTSTPNSPTFFQIGSSSLLWYLSSSTKYLTTTGGLSMTASTALNLNTWNHIAISRSGSSTNNTKMYLNGVKVAETTNNTSFTGDASNGLRIGAEYTSGFYLNGYASNVRVVKGTAVYTGDSFTVPTTPLTAITNTQLLTCQGNRFKDASANNFTLTVTGSPSVQRFSPFAPTAEYDASVIGGSGYFDGSGDYLSTPATGQFTASGNFTVSCWFYLNSFAASYYVVGGNWSATTSDEWLIQVQNNGAIRFLTSAGTAFSSAGVVKLKEWTFFSATRTGTTVTVQVNGSTVSTYTKSDTLGAANKAVTIGWQPGGSWPWNGYIADFRLVSGSAVSSIPTTPLTAIAGTGLLLSMTNAGIIDNAEMNDLETVGNAQVSTSVKKFGTGSIYLDGNGDYLSTPDNPSLQLGTGNFTIECWVYPLSVNGSNANPLINKLNGGSNTGWLLGMSSTSLWQFSTGSSVIVRAGAVSLNTWTHLAAVRSSGTTTLYVNGTSVGSTATAFNFTDTVPLRIGWESSFVYCNAYVDDLRITKGYARYTSNFTPPTSAFPNQ